MADEPLYRVVGSSIDEDVVDLQPENCEGVSVTVFVGKGVTISA